MHADELSALETKRGRMVHTTSHCAICFFVAFSAYATKVTGLIESNKLGDSNYFLNEKFVKRVIYALRRRLLIR